MTSADAPHLHLPASVVLALWLPRVRSGDEATARAGLAAAAIASGLDLPVEQTLADAVDPAALPGLLADLAPVAQVGAVLPTPGDPMGLPAAAETSSGEAVVVVTQRNPGTSLVLAPSTMSFGSDLEPGVLVEWRATAVAGPVSLNRDGLSFARRELHHAMEEVIDTLTDLDVARMSPELADDLNETMLATLNPATLPPGMESARVAMVEKAARLRAIVELALRDEGGAITGGQMTARRAALIPIERAARRAMCAASLTQGHEGRS